MNANSPENIQEMLQRAEMALIQGNFVKAKGLSRSASSLMDRTQEMHRRFLKALRGFVERISYMDDWGYDVSEARDILRRARDRAVKSEYEAALDTVSRVEGALKRATYLPFPLLNKTIDIITVITFKDGKIHHFIRVENPSDDPLGELIIRPFLKEGDFKEVVEKNFGNVGARWWAEWTFILTPLKKDWNLGVGREILMGEGVIMKTKLSSRPGKAIYSVTIENNSDQIMRDVVLVPMIPSGLESDPPEGLLDYVPPFGQRSFEFSLKPSGGPKKEERSEGRKVEKVVVIADEGVEIVEPVEEAEGETDETGPEGEEEGGDEVLDWGVDERPVGKKGPTDFTPVEEEYDLVDRSPFKYPKGIEEEMDRSKRSKVEQ